MSTVSAALRFPGRLFYRVDKMNVGPISQKAIVTRPLRLLKIIINPKPNSEADMEPKQLVYCAPTLWSPSARVQLSFVIVVVYEILLL